MKKTLLYKILILVGFLFSTQTVFTQNKNIRFEQLNLEVATTNCILQDMDGFMWLGTNTGLYIYDAYQFKAYRNNPDDTTSIAHNYIRSICQDKDGNIWVGSMGGLSRFDKLTKRFSNYFVGIYMRHVSVGSDGNLWLATDQGLIEFNPETEKSKSYTHNKDNLFSISFMRSLCSFEDSEGILWVGTGGGGLNRFDKNSEQFYHYKNDSTDDFSLSNNNVLSIFEDSKKRLWIGTEQGLNLYNRDTDKFTVYKSSEYDFPDNVIFSICEDNSGVIWTTTFSGLNRLDFENNIFITYKHDPDNKNSFADNGLRSVCFSKKDNLLWIGGYYGAYVFDKTSERFETFELSDMEFINSMHKRFILEGSSGFWWYAAKDWIGKFNPTDSSIKRFYYNKSLSGQFLFLDSSDTLWVAFYKHFAKFDESRKTFQYYEDNSDYLADLSSSIIDIAEDKLGNLYLATEGGLILFNRKNETFRYFRTDANNPSSISSNRLTSLLYDSNNTLWVGTYNGLNKFDVSNQTFKRYQKKDKNMNSLINNKIFTVFEDSQTNLWIGSAGGLSYFDAANDNFINYKQNDGLQNNFSVYSIIEKDSGILWLTVDGLSKFNVASKQFVNYFKEDGLPLNGIALSDMDKDGNIYIKGDSQLFLFHPDSIKENTNPPIVVLTDFLLFNKSVAISDTTVLHQNINFTKKIVLNYTDYAFAFEFSALNYRQSEKNQFKYKLENFDKEWVDADYEYRKATYSNVPHGEYTFRVIASNDDGCWNKEGISIQVIILPPFWLTWWAKTLYVLAGLSLVFLFIRSQQLKVKRKEAELQKEKAISTKLRQADELKDEFLANTSHELRTPINGIIGLADSLIDGAAGQLPAKAIDDLSLLVSSGKRLSNLVNDILDFSKMRDNKLVLQSQAVDLFATVDVVLRLSQTLKKGRKLEIINNIPQDILPVQADENRLQQILYNLVGNAMKFTEKGSVIVSCEYDESPQSAIDRLEKNSSLQNKFVIRNSQFVIIKVSDTGIGISKDKFETIFESFEQADGSTAREYGGTGIGLAVTRQLVELQGGKIWLESEVNKGSVFYFTIPLSIESKINKLQNQDAVVTKIISEVDVNQPEINTVIEQFSSNEDKFRVLVVDDESVNLRVLDNQLKTQNYSVVLAEDGFEALEILKNDNQIDIVILDIMMPKMSGYEVCEKIREQISASHLPVIMLTAKNRLVDLITGFNSGANDYLTKPFSKEELIARISIHLELLQANREIIEYSNSLEKKVKERTQKIEQQNVEILTQTEKLKATNEKLIELDHFKKGMTGMIVHDLKNPLNSIINIPKSFSIEKQVKRMKQSGKQMLNMVMNILDVQKYEETKMVVDKSNYSLYELSQNAINEVSFLAEQKCILIKNQIPTEIGVQADKEIVERIFVNLLTNAVKFTPNNGEIIINGELLMVSEAKAKPQLTINNSSFIIIKVTDTGQGIPKDKLNRVFDKFGQVVVKKSGNVRSTGLGLAFCKMAVEAHGGEISVESEEEKGTTFLFTLPVGEKFEDVKKIEPILKYDSLELTEEEKNIINLYICGLKKLLVYEITEIEKILQKIDFNSTTNLQKWKAEMDEVLFTLNEEKYNELLRITISK